MTDLLGQLLDTVERDLPAVYCVVVATRGSTPQKAGAAMLVFPDGSQAGTLGGGCVEAEVEQAALLASGPQIRTFILDDDYGWDDGLICGGRMTILADPVTPERASYYRKLLDLTSRGTGFTEAIVLGELSPLVTGDRYLFDAGGRLSSFLAATPNSDAVAANLQPIAARPSPSVEAGVAYLPSLPRITLLLVGGGHVAQAVARLAAEVGFAIWVMDDRERFASEQRFPAAERRLVGSIGEMLRDLSPTLSPSTYSLILTRGHNHDEEALFHLAESKCGYVGMIGSRRKIRLIFDDLATKGISPDALGLVHAPLGFAIGSQTVPEIAISIVAELIARRNLGDTKLPRASWERTSDDLRHRSRCGS